MNHLTLTLRSKSTDAAEYPLHHVNYAKFEVATDNGLGEYSFTLTFALD